MNKGVVEGQDLNREKQQKWQQTECGCEEKRAGSDFWHGPTTRAMEVPLTEIENNGREQIWEER